MCRGKVDFREYFDVSKDKWLMTNLCVPPLPASPAFPGRLPCPAFARVRSPGSVPQHVARSGCIAQYTALGAVYARRQVSRLAQVSDGHAWGWCQHQPRAPRAARVIGSPSYAC